jgi:hypothetical protein
VDPFKRVQLSQLLLAYVFYIKENDTCICIFKFNLSLSTIALKYLFLFFSQLFHVIIVYKLEFINP